MVDTIEHGIPLSPSRLERLPPAKHFARVAALEVGDSFLVPLSEGTYASAYVSKYQKTHPGTKFVRRWLPEGVRIWRVEPCPNS